MTATPMVEASTARAPIPLRERRYDWFFIVVFAVFASTSFSFDLVNVLTKPAPDADFALARLMYRIYADHADPLLAANPRFVQIASSISALVFGPFYLIMIYAFIRGREWIRIPAVFYAGMIVQTTVVFLLVGLTGDAALFRTACETVQPGFDYTFVDLPRVLFGNLPYLIVPLLLVLRLWQAHPFTRAES